MTPVRGESREVQRTSWERHDNPHWQWEIKLDGEPVPVASGSEQDTGLNVLDRIIARVPGLIYKADEEPHTLTIELTTVPF